MNREERRQYSKLISKEKKLGLVSVCPQCNNEARFVAIPSDNKLGKTCSVVCEVCDSIVKEDVPNLAPYSFVRI